ncbi:MAG: ATP-dependent zinc metalloprotease FtsH [Clostridiales bacterium]|nr:ATP-dependent zinc metalloprotease FtsH [Clostridiales bacterium]
MKKYGYLKNIIVLLVFVGAAVLIALSLGSGKPEERKPDEIIAGVLSGEIVEIQITTYRVVYRKSGSATKEKDFPKRFDGYAYVSSRVNFENVLRERYAEHLVVSKTAEWEKDGKTADEIALELLKLDTSLPDSLIEFDDPNRGAVFMNIVLPILGFLIVGVVVFFMFRQTQGANVKAMNFGKTKARVTKDVKIRFSDVAGVEEEKEELREIVEFLKAPKKFTELGARIPKGVLLVGEPGTGKTLFAKAVAGEARVPFFNISGSDFVEMFVGVGASRVRDLFEQAKLNKPCIIFIDEIDAVGRQRGAGLGGGHDEREQTLNQLLVHMDGFETNEGIIVMAATNRVDILDQALLRPGRFDRQIYINVPDVKGREAILRVHSRNKKLAPDVNLQHIARLTGGFTGADLENLLNEAAILTARAGRAQTNMADIGEAVNKVTAGPQKKSRLVTEFDKRITAYHEAGHAVVARTVPNHDNVHEVSIIPRGPMAGYTLMRPDNDDNHMTKGKFISSIKTLLAGRAAEEIILDDISAGASSDIKRASGIARKMIAELGMSETLGNIYLGSDNEVFLGRDYQAHKNYSEEIAAVIDNEVKRLIDGCYGEAKRIVSENLSVIENMVKLLYKRETIYTAEIDMLFAGKTAAEIEEYLAGEERKKAEKAEDNTAKPEDNIAEDDGGNAAENDGEKRDSE